MKTLKLHEEKLLLLIVSVFLIIFIMVNLFLQKYHNRYIFMHNESYSICNEAESLNDLKCKNIKSKSDPLIRYYQLINDTSFSSIVYFGPLLVIIPCAIIIHRNMKNGYMKNVLTRTSYSSYIKSVMKKTIKFSVILPVFIMIMLLISGILCRNFSYGTHKEMFGYFTSPSIEFYGRIPQFLLIYIFNMLLFSIFYMNLTYICAKKSSNVFVTIIYTYLCYFVIDIIGEVFVGGLLFAQVLNYKGISDYLNLLNVWAYFDIHNLLYLCIYPISLVLVSSIIVYFLYKKRERILILNEK